MDVIFKMKRIFTLLLLIFVSTCLFLILSKNGFIATHQPEWQIFVSSQSITPINDSKHFMVSAFCDHRVAESIRIISIIHRPSVQPLYCVYCKENHGCNVSGAFIYVHSDHFRFPFATADILCHNVDGQYATHVTISTVYSIAGYQKKTFLPIRNKLKISNHFQYNFTVCISSLFGNYNNVLQVAQAMEMYKILGVDHVVLYNTSCGPDLEKLLQQYRKEGFLEVVPWPINQFLNPSSGWNHVQHEGDIHYYGQLITLNECVYRHMYQSKYLLLNDIDEIIMPYQHRGLPQLMEYLDGPEDKPRAEVFIIESHLFPQNVFDDRGTFSVPDWNNLPGVNLLEHIYREPDQKNVFNPSKMIINPRKVFQTSVHSVLKHYGRASKVPFDVCLVVHVREPFQPSLTKDELIVDTRVWDFQMELIPNVNRILKMSGLIKMKKS